jgi:hypothetical protein
MGLCLGQFEAYFFLGIDVIQGKRDNIIVYIGQEEKREDRERDYRGD